MPRIPTYDQPQVQADSTIRGREASGLDFGTQVDAAQGQFFETVNVLSQHMLKMHNQAKLEGTIAQGASELQQTAQQLSQGSLDKDGNFVPPPPVEQHEKIFNDAVQRIDDAARKTLVDDDVYLQFKSRFDSAAQSQLMQIRKNGIAQQKDSALATFDDAINTHTHMASVQTGVEREASVAQAARIIDLAAQGGLITRVDAVKRKEQLAREIDQADVVADMRDPEKALKNLQNPDMYPAVKPEARQAYITQAVNLMEKDQRERLAAEEHLVRVQEKAQRQVEKATGKQAEDLFVTGKLTPQWLAANADNMSNDDYRHFNDKLAKGDENTKSNAQVYGDLRFRQSQNEDVTAEAKAHYLAGDLSHNDYTTLTTKPDDDPTRKKTWFKDGEDYIKTAFYIDRFSSDAQKHLLADTHDKWKEWADAHPDAAPADARKEYQELSRAAGRIDPNASAAALPMPRFFKGSRATMTKETLAAAMQETLKAFQKGDIDQRQYDDEIELNHNYVTILKQRETADAAAAKTLEGSKK